MFLWKIFYTVTVVEFYFFNGNMCEKTPRYKLWPCSGCRKTGVLIPVYYNGALSTQYKWCYWFNQLYSYIEKCYFYREFVFDVGNLDLRIIMLKNCFTPFDFLFWVSHNFNWENKLLHFKFFCKIEKIYELICL